MALAGAPMPRFRARNRRRADDGWISGYSSTFHPQHAEGQAFDHIGRKPCGRRRFYGALMVMDTCLTSRAEHAGATTDHDPPRGGAERYAVPAVRSGSLKPKQLGVLGDARCGGLAGTARIHDSGAQLAFAVRGARHRHDDARPRHRVRRGQDQTDRPFRHAAGGRHPAQADESQTRRRAVAARAGPPHQAYGGAVRRARPSSRVRAWCRCTTYRGRSDGYRRFPFGRPDWSQGLHHPDSGVHLARSAVFSASSACRTPRSANRGNASNPPVRRAGSNGRTPASPSTCLPRRCPSGAPRTTSPSRPAC